MEAVRCFLEKAPQKEISVYEYCICWRGVRRNLWRWTNSFHIPN